MPEITDEIIKRKRNEFIKDIQTTLNELQAKAKEPDLMTTLRDASARMTARRPMFKFPGLKAG